MVERRPSHNARSLTVPMLGKLVTTAADGYGCRRSVIHHRYRAVAVQGLNFPIRPANGAKVCTRV
ncbi:hypothetical protein I547_1320 [Mycobacterium kansasii 824]|nr:hypothetical protein I547_1320 [Mycobacterium kansasii 824]